MTTNTKDAAVAFLLSANRATKALQIWAHCVATGDPCARDLEQEFERERGIAQQRAADLKALLAQDGLP